MTTLLCPAARLTPDRATDPGSLAAHHAEHGPLPRLAPDQLLATVTAAGLTGRGGAGFPSARKLAAVRAARGRPIVVGNASEGEPASRKDAWLLAHRPHLVLDGLQLVVSAVGASSAYLVIGATELLPGLEALAAERRRTRVDRVAVEVVAAAPTFLAGEESALVNALAGRAPVPRSKPPRVIERGLRNRPTLVHNVETLAHIALTVRRGATWFREAGTPAEPGTALLTVSGGVARPGVYEVPLGSPLPDALELAGGPTTPLQAVLLGGYHGGWLGAADAARARLSRESLQPLGTSLGAGVVVALPAEVCGLAETARVLRYLADAGARQCGPCLNGLPRLATLAAALATGRPDPRVRAELERVAGLVEGRGACHHPDGTVRFLRSALVVFRTEIDRHLAGRCSAIRSTAILPTPGVGDRAGVR